MKEILKLENVVKVYGSVRAVNGANLTVCAGERTFIHGPLGSGKSTLLRLIAGAEKPDSGRISIPKNIGVAQEQNTLIPEYTILENAALPLKLAGERLARKKADILLERLGIRYIAEARPERVSPVERRLAALARAAIGQPELLLIDELSAGFGPREAERLWKGLDALTQETDTTALLFSTENDAQRSDKIYAMQYGQIVAP